MLVTATEQCSRILGEIDGVQVDLQSSRKVQETVYNSFQKVSYIFVAPVGLLFLLLFLFYVAVLLHCFICIFYFY